MDLKKLDIVSKIKLLTGKGGNFTNDLDGMLNSYVLADGPHGVKGLGERKKATWIPCLQNLGNSWSEEVAYLMGSVIADDCILNSVDILLAPGINIKRVAVSGRNFEYISEDPFLTGMLAGHYVRGLQDKGIGATVKHFCANNREYARFTVSSEVDERTLREVYMKAFQMVLEEKPWLVMCSYNPLNGWYTSENRSLLKGVLRDELGFDGVIVSDWCAVHDRAKSLKATLDLEMPYAARSEQNLADALKRGFISEKEIDESIGRIQDLYNKIENSKSKRVVSMTEEQRHLATVKMSEESIVLLKNKDKLLPLRSYNKIAVLGEQAAKPEMGGGGSSTLAGYSEYKQMPLADLLQKEFPDSNIRYCNGYNIVTFIGHRNREFLGKTAIKAALESDIAIVCVGNNYAIESECFDRENIKLPIIHENLIKQICEVNENVVVIVTAGSCIDMTAWIDKVKAVIYTGFGGEGINEALVNVLTGKVCPSGKLSETFINSIDDNPNNKETGNGFVERYTDGVMVGYKYYEYNNIPVGFPFGFGMSYASFEYSDLKVEKVGEADYKVSYNITNTSDICAKEVSQIYVKDILAMVEQPPKALKAFCKTEIKPHKTKRIVHTLHKDAFEYYSPVIKGWFVENGWFEIMIGASANDIKLKQRVLIELDEDSQNSKYDELYLNAF